MGFEVMSLVGLICVNRVTVPRPREEGPWVDPRTDAPRAVAIVLSLADALTRFLLVAVVKFQASVATSAEGTKGQEGSTTVGRNS